MTINCAANLYYLASIYLTELVLLASIGSYVSDIFLGKEREQCAKKEVFMLKSALIALAFTPSVHSLLPPSHSNVLSSCVHRTHPHATAFSQTGLKMQDQGDQEASSLGSWGLPRDDASLATTKLEMLLNEDDFTQDYVKEILNSAAYALLPDLKDHLANKRIEQIQNIHGAFGSNAKINYIASYYATYVAVRFLDEVSAPLAASLLTQTRLVPSLKEKSDKGMELPNIAELVFPEGVMESLWFETLKISEFPLGLEDELHEFLFASRRQIPIGLAYDQLDPMTQLTEQLQSFYLNERGDLDEGFNKMQWTLAQCLVLQKMASEDEMFVRLWTELYNVFASTDISFEQVSSFHDYLLGWIGVSYLGEEQFFQRLHEDAKGYRRKYDFYANAFCKVLKWHRPLIKEG